MGEAKFSRIFGIPLPVNFGTVHMIVECKNVLLGNNEEVEHQEKIVNRIELP